MDRLQSMQIFCRVIDLNGFAAAARDLNLSPSVVTRLINELEEHLGSRLINRTTRKLVLTEAGERYLEQVRRILADVAQVEAEVGSDAAEPRGVLKVLAPPAFAAHQLAPILPRFRALYPRIAIDLSAPGMVETLDENFDVSIIAAQGKPLDGSFVARRLASSTVVLCASPGYLNQHGRPTHPQELLRHDMLSPKRPCELTFYPEPDGQADGSRPQPLTLSLPSPTLSTGHLDTTLHATVAGLGIGGFPSYVIAQALAQGTLERVLPQWRLFEMGIYAAIPSRRHLPAKTRAFFDFLVSTFGGEERDPWLGKGKAADLAVLSQRVA
ncbi:MAG: LysR family transcriptional regulator [Aquabacterium sp.]|uniref:LysR family transcriptional regulator n=1 Tax=Aquabacterium sp. TaxID=1872578 RepID=UPI002716DECE|nr:LysR family transcriptional regulator [Aquabacterium sp.]MDO9003154.1 LysR family transcriptional regulator [Aquabacterium sp.]